jgi:undecaprenyl diphosphate synthase
VTVATNSNGHEGLTKIPRHVAIIMDGNGRWANQRGLARVAGHRAGTDNIRPLLEACVEVGIRVLTIFAFSTENWQRPRDEVEALFSIMADAIERETPELHRQGVQVRHVGSTDGLPADLAASITQATALTANNRRITLNVAFNYGGRAEIVAAFRRAVADGVDPSAIDELTVDRYLTTAGQPDPDLIIRTAGEMRLSNFLIWQAAYAEYYSTPTYWPEFGRDQLIEALAVYGRRERRFGGLVPA